MRARVAGYGPVAPQLSALSLSETSKPRSRGNCQAPCLKLIEMSSRVLTSGGEMFTNLLDIIKNTSAEEAEPESNQIRSRRQSLRKSFQERVKKSCGTEEDKAKGQL